MEDASEIPEDSLQHVEALLARHPPQAILRMFSQAARTQPHSSASSINSSNSSLFSRISTASSASAASSNPAPSTTYSSSSRFRTRAETESYPNRLSDNSASNVPIDSGRNSMASPSDSYWFCTFCPDLKTFSMKSDWKMHEMRMHETGEDWPCPVPGCSRIFDREKDFLRHCQRYHPGCQLPSLTDIRVLLLPRNVFGCGFDGCKDYIVGWDNRCNHVSEHMKQGKTFSQWKYSNIIQNLIHQDATREIWKELLSSIQHEISRKGRSQITWCPDNTRILKQKLECCDLRPDREEVLLIALSLRSDLPIDPRYTKLPNSFITPSRNSVPSNISSTQRMQILNGNPNNTVSKFRLNLVKQAISKAVAQSMPQPSTPLSADESSAPSFTEPTDTDGRRISLMDLDLDPGLEMQDTVLTNNMEPQIATIPDHGRMSMLAGDRIGSIPKSRLDLVINAPSKPGRRTSWIDFFLDLDPPGLGMRDPVLSPSLDGPSVALLDPKPTFVEPANSSNPLALLYPNYFDAAPTFEQSDYYDRSSLNQLITKPMGRIKSGLHSALPAANQSPPADEQSLPAAEQSPPAPEQSLSAAPMSVSGKRQSVYGSSPRASVPPKKCEKLAEHTASQEPFANLRQTGQQNDKPQITEHVVKEQDSSAEPSIDYQSTIFADSVIVLTPQQRKHVTDKFSNALLRDLSSTCFVSEKQTIESSLFNRQFLNSVQDYSKEVIEGTDRRSRRRQVSKAIRVLRHEILGKCYEQLGGFAGSDNRDKPSIVLQIDERDKSQKSVLEKVDDWDIQPLGNVDYSFFGSTSSVPLYGNNDDCALSEMAEQNFSEISSTGPIEDLTTEDQNLYQYLTEHSAFEELIERLKVLVERHFCAQKELIHHKMLLALRRPSVIENFVNRIFRAVFIFDVKILAFLQESYIAGRSQDLRYIVGITGTTVNAQLATVETYLQQVWPENSWELVEALNLAISKAGSNIRSRDIYPTSTSKIEISLEDMKISVCGSEDFLVTIGQQLAWLGAVCQSAPGQLAHSYINFTEVSSLVRGSPTLKFQIRYEVIPLGPLEKPSCWNDLVGNSVLVRGFPSARRNCSAIGLEIPFPIMATMGNVPLITLYRGGYILKGRSEIFVPVKRGADYIQWHLYRHPTRRIFFHDINKMFPNRLLVNTLDGDEVRTLRCFLGWCPESSNSLASGSYDYEAIGYTKTPYLSKKVLSFTGASIGFQQFGAGSLNFAISKRGRMHHLDKAQYYQDLLDAAKQIPVILQDMQDRRAWYADGERIILHVILHRHAIRPYNANGIVQLASAEPGDLDSVRKAMLDNADVLVSYDRDMGQAGLQSKTFKDLVNELYSILEGLMAETVDIADAGIELKLDWKKHVQGWEYMDLVNRKLTPCLREATLRPTCGQWPELARDRNAVVLFGNQFKSVISPQHSLPLCKQFQELPKNKDYLAIESSKLEDMYMESGAVDDRTQITLTGMQLHRSRLVFEGCPRSTFKADCECDRIQQLVPKKVKGAVNPIPKMQRRGALIIGEGKFSWINELGNSWEALREVFHHRHLNPQGDNQPPQQVMSTDVAPQNLPSSCTSENGSKSTSSLENLSSFIATPSTDPSSVSADRSAPASLQCESVPSNGPS